MACFSENQHGIDTGGPQAFEERRRSERTENSALKSGAIICK